MNFRNRATALALAIALALSGSSLSSSATGKGTGNAPANPSANSNANANKPTPAKPVPTPAVTPAPITGGSVESAAAPAAPTPAPGNSGSNSKPADERPANPGASAGAPGNSGDRPNTPAPSASATGSANASSNSPASSERPVAPVIANTERPGKLKNASEECADFIDSKQGSTAASCTPARYVLRFESGVDPDAQVKGMRAIKIPVQAVFRGVFAGAVADLNAGQLKALVASGRISSIEEDFEIKLAATQENPAWGLDRVDQLDLPLSRTYTNTQQGSGVKAYIVDTGVLAPHADFNGRVTAGFSAIADGRGATDCNGHGTHVAGTVGGTTYGVAKQVQLVPVRVLDCAGSGQMSGVVAGLDWIAQQHVVGTPAVVNMSLGGGASSTLDNAVAGLVNKGIPVVVAAGNSAADACNTSPARTPGALTVAASSATDGFASFSNFGTCVDMVAPGVDVASAWYTSTTAVVALSGTSMAAPHVAGLVASMLTAGYKTPGQIEFELEGKAAVGKIQSIPSGTPNLLAQVVVAAPVITQPSSESTVIVQPPAATVPIAPVITGTSTQKTALRVNWQISPNGGSPITSHIVKVWQNGSLTREITAGATATSLRISGLKIGVSYTFTVVAVNSVGRSADSNVSAAYTPRR